MKQSNLQGIIWMLTSCIASSIMVAVVRHISADMHVMQVIFMRNLISIMLFLPWVFYVKKSFPKSGNFKLQFLRALCSLIAMVLYFYAIAEVNLSVVTTLSFGAPIIASILAVLILKEGNCKKRWFSLMLGVIGTLVVLRPGMEGFNSYSLLVVIATFFWGASVIMIKILTRTDCAMTITFYTALLMTPISLIMAFPYLEAISVSQIGWLFALAVISILLQVALTKAFSLADVTVVQPFDFTRLIFTAVIAWYAFGETLDEWTIIGAVIIISATLYSTYTEIQKNKSSSPDNKNCHPTLVAGSRVTSSKHSKIPLEFPKKNSGNDDVVKET